MSVTVVGIVLGLLYYTGPKLGNQSAALWTLVRQQVDHLRETYGNTPWSCTLLQDFAPASLVKNHLANYAG